MRKNSSYVQGIFSVLAEKLTFLDISGNLANKYPVSYPGEALSVLNSLKTLRLDCISGLKLDREFGNLTNLKKLDFSDGIQAHYLPDDMFSSISKLNVESFNFANVNVTEVSGQVFSTLRSLRVLDFSNNPLASQNVIQISDTLDQTSIEELYLENNCLGLKTPSQEIILNRVMLNLNRTKIRILTLDRNYIHEMKSVFHYIRAIEILTITNNRLYDYDRFFYDYLKPPNLTKLDMSIQNLNPEPTCGTLSQPENVKPFHHRIEPIVNSDFRDNRKAWSFIWPKKLEWIALSNVNGLKMTQVPEVAFLNNGSIKYADVSNNHFETFPYLVYCRNRDPLVISTMEHLDASNCRIKCVTKDILQNCICSLKFANFSHNEIGLFEGDCNNKHPTDTLLIFKSVPTLETLDLSYNSIALLFNDTFDASINLMKLFLSHNKLSSWKPNLINSVYLEYLDLSYNNFQTLPFEHKTNVS